VAPVDVFKVRIGLAVLMGVVAVVVANHWREWMPHSGVLIVCGALAFAIASAVGAYRIRYLQEKFGVIQIPVFWESEMVQVISWDIVAYATIFSALVIGGLIASMVASTLPLSLVPLAYILSIILTGILRWILSIGMAAVMN
jgi:hypothetical protein